MKKILFLLLTMIILSCNHTNSHIQSNNYVIKGKVTGFNDSTKVFLTDINIDKTIDSTFIIKDTFYFSGKFKNDSVPEQLWLEVKPDAKKLSFYTNLLIKNGDNVTINGDKKDFPFYLKIKGSKTQDEAFILDSATRDLNSNYDALIQTYFSLNEKEKESEKGKKLVDSLNKISNKISQIEKDYIQKHINTFNGVIELYYNRKQFDKDTIKKLFDKVNNTIKNSKYGKRISFYINNKILAIGDSYHDFKAINQKSDSVKLSDYINDNKYILLDFNATYCGPCVLSVDELKEINSKYGDKITIIGFNVDSNKDIWDKGLKRDSISWPSLWDGKGNSSSTYIIYGISGVPTFFLIDPNGKIMDKDVGYEKRSLIEMLKKNKIIK